MRDNRTGEEEGSWLHIRISCCTSWGSSGFPVPPPFFPGLLCSSRRSAANIGKRRTSGAMKHLLMGRNHFKKEVLCINSTSESSIDSSLKHASSFFAVLELTEFRRLQPPRSKQQILPMCRKETGRCWIFLSLDTTLMWRAACLLKGFRHLGSSHSY